MEKTRFERGQEMLAQIDGAGGEQVRAAAGGSHQRRTASWHSGGKIVEACMHCVPYVGFPRVLNAVFVAKRVFSQRAAQESL